MCVCVSIGSQEKLSLCSSYGADVTIDYKTQDFADVILTETRGKGGYPLKVVVCVYVSAVMVSR